MPEEFTPQGEEIREACFVIGNQIELTAGGPTPGVPLTHFIDAPDPQVYARFCTELRDYLTKRGKHVLDDISMQLPEPDRSMAVQGFEFFEILYEAISKRDIKTNPTDVQLVRVDDISSSFAQYAGGAIHSFLQEPLSPHYTSPDPRSFVSKILDANPQLPKCVVLFHLGKRAGERAYETGRMDAGIVHFKNGFWHLGNDLESLDRA